MGIIPVHMIQTKYITQQGITVIITIQMWSARKAYVVLFVLLPLKGQTNEQCNDQITCGACIVVGSECTWCQDKVYFTKGQPATRCDTVENHHNRKCQIISNPESNYNASENKKLDSTTNVTPQNLTLRLRKGQPAQFNVSMRTPVDFPVDLYYLMDLSGSMFQDMKRITTLGTRIANEMSQITKQFRLGFGTFVDKPLAPFIDTHPNIVKHPHFVPSPSGGFMTDLNSIPAFGYRNSLPLDLNTSKFEKNVAEQNISGNVDNPEGGLDALLQVAVCHKDIGWDEKESARRLVVFTTDSSYHFAGDGLLGGVVLPNDGQCHLSNGEYVGSTFMDYPSLGQLRQILLENQVVPIFAITKNQKPIYDEVVQFFGEESFAVAAELSTDGSNIVTLIREAYEKIAKTQTISDNSTAGVSIQYKAICPDKTYDNTKTCNDVKIGETVTFEVSVTAEKCSPDMPDRVHLRTAFGDVALKLEYLCDCECEELDHQELSSKHCSSNGSLICGICDCHDGWSGRLCNCEAGKEFKKSLCQTNQETGQICSGRGDCLCGECQCKESKTPGEKFYGKNCECSNINCPRNEDDELCGGPRQGTCDCGKCKCHGNWTGPSCSCTTDVEACINDGIVCSNRGSCLCGQCVCNGSSSCVGPFCEPVPGCLGLCEANKNCVYCKTFNRSQCDKQLKCDTKNTNMAIVEEIDSSMGETCDFMDHENCRFYFAYKFLPDKLQIYVKRKKDCEDDLEPLVVILAVIGGILAIGLALLLIWRLLATIQDRREFAKFQKERQNAKWDTGENPIFKQATTTFQNPTYGKS